MMPSTRVLLIDDDPESCAFIESLCTNICDKFSRQSFDSKAIQSVESEEWDVVLINSKYPGVAGKKVCSSIRAVKPLSQIIVMSHSDEESHVCEYLTRCADDCIARPFSKFEFQARIISALRRSMNLRYSDSSVSAVVMDYSIPEFSNGGSDQIELNSSAQISDDLKLYPSSGAAVIDGISVSLTSVEFLLFSYLLENRDRACSKAELLTNVLEYKDDCYLRSLYSHINRLRRKIEQANSASVAIKTVWRFGYQAVVQ